MNRFSGDYNFPSFGSAARPHFLKQSPTRGISVFVSSLIMWIITNETKLQILPSWPQIFFCLFTHATTGRAVVRLSPRSRTVGGLQRVLHLPPTLRKTCMWGELKPFCHSNSPRMHLSVGLFGQIVVSLCLSLCGSVNWWLAQAVVLLSPHGSCERDAWINHWQNALIMKQFHLV